MQIFRQGRREEIGRSKGRKGIPSLCSSSATLSWACKVRGVNVQGILETISKNQFVMTLFAKLQNAFSLVDRFSLNSVLWIQFSFAICGR